MGRRGRSEGSIFQRASDKRWVGSVTISRPGQPRRRKSVVRERRADVVTALRVVQNSVDRGVVPAGRSVTVRTYVNEWLTGVPNLRDRTRLRYRELLELHVLPEIGGLPLAKLQPAHVRTMLARLGAKPGRGGRPLSAQTVVHARAAIRRALSDAVGDGLIARNPAAGKTVNAPTPEHREVEAMTPERAATIVAAVWPDPMGPMFTFLLSSGLRLGEALGLSWTSVDREPGGAIRVRRTYGIVGGVGQFGEPKTRQSRRDVPVNHDILVALREQRRRQAEARLAAGPEWHDEGLVFTRWDGSPLDPRDASKRLHHLLRPIGLEALRVHDLRHGYVTLLLRERASFAEVAKLAGHASPVMTLNVYGHVASDSLQEAARRLDGLGLTGQIG